MRRLLSSIALSVSLLPAAAHAQTLTLRHDHYLFTMPDKTVQSWMEPQETWMFNGQEIDAPQELRVDGDNVPSLPQGMAKSAAFSVSESLIEEALRTKVAPSLEREPGTVKIKKNGEKIEFEGVGLPGRKINMEKSAALIAEALRLGVIDITLVIDEPQPTITVEDAGLRQVGIKEVVTVGESDMSNSPANRRHNIATGLSKFNGHLIPQDSVFSFDETLGPVDGSTGYLKELVIKGDKTVPDYGGGLCQVSSTAYRGVWEYGFPILQRINHSYSVNHYSPPGTDATVYPPNVDIKFKNDSPGALLIQTHRDGDDVFFIYYGTKDNRHTAVIGPFIWGRVAPPPQKTEYTTDLPLGEKKKVGEAVPGLKAAWYRFVNTGTGTVMETVLSSYQARPLFYQVGGAAPSGSGATAPGWLEVDVSG